MKNFILIILNFCSMTLVSQTTCKITYIANDGFLINTADKKVLVSALFGVGEGNWYDKPNDYLK